MTSATLPERILRECDCPPGIERCIHFGDDVLWFISDEVLKWHHCCGSTATVPYAVWFRSQLEACEVDGTPFTHPNRVEWLHNWADHSFETRDAALAAFHEAERRLLEAPE